MLGFCPISAVPVSTLPAATPSVVQHAYGPLIFEAVQCVSLWVQAVQACSPWVEEVQPTSPWVQKVKAI
jgi:hypothetical protein